MLTKSPPAAVSRLTVPITTLPTRQETTEARLLYILKLPTCSKLVDNHITLHLSPLHLHKCMFDVLRSFAGLPGVLFPLGIGIGMTIGRMGLGIVSCFGSNGQV